MAPTADPPATLPAYPEHLRAEVEGYLESIRFCTEFASAGLEEAMRYSLLAGGKRIRPVLALATAEAAGRARDSVLPLAAARWAAAARMWAGSPACSESNSLKASA